MTNRLEKVSARRLSCARCGTEFNCDPGGACWCFEESVRLPLPATDQAGFKDCLCARCLRELAVTAEAGS